MRLYNVRHELFARAVAKGEYASRAYKLAGYSATGHSAEASASRLLKKVEIQARINELRAEADARSGRTLERTFTELAQVAFANPFDHIAFDEDGDPNLKFPAENRGQASAMQGVVIEEYEGEDQGGGRRVKRTVYRSADKLTALAKLADLLMRPQCSQSPKR